MLKYLILNTALILSSFTAWSQVDWSTNAQVEEVRDNIYQLSPQEFAAQNEKGKHVALLYPVDVSELLIPYNPLKNFFETPPNDPVRKLLFKLAQVVSPFNSMNEVFNWLGVHPYPQAVQIETPNPLPYLTQEEQELPMGATIIHTPDGDALTFGCGACHVGNLFGVKVLGLTNRFPRANEFFRQGKTLAPYVNSFIFKDLLKTTEGERLLMQTAKNATKWVGTKKPEALGLDTTLAQIGLSLARREKDPYATRTTRSHMFPRPTKLDKLVADSKPAVWWNVKYKTRWLSDGSIVSGNPVHTNFLWNEIGRGTDLKKFETWMDANEDKIKALTVAVFASKSPRYEAFFGASSIDVEKAKLGQKHFVQSCQKCHGQYQKAWDGDKTHHLSAHDLVKTLKTVYHKKTPVMNVGTDPGRYQGMQYFSEELNQLQISKRIQTVVVPQVGYVPPPLDGIWSRWPYFHNNSIPNLCALLTKSSERPKSYYSGEALDKERDFDQDCVGYPLGEKTPKSWKTKDFFYDNKREGLSNSGHDEGIFLKEGKDIYTQAQKSELIEFLKTL